MIRCQNFIVSVIVLSVNHQLQGPTQSFSSQSLDPLSSRRPAHAGFEVE